MDPEETKAAELQQTTEQTQTAPKQEQTQQQETKVEVQGAAETKPAAAETKTEAEAKPEAKPETSDWRNAEIARLRTKLAEARQAKARVEVKQGAGETAEDFEARVEARARELATEQTTKADWDRRMNEMVAQGRSQFSATVFNERVRAIRDMVDANDPAEVQQYQTLLAAAAETGAGPAILHELGGNPGKFMELMGEQPLKMTVALTNLASELKKPAGLSEAPKPIRPIGSSGVHLEGIAPDDPEKGTRLPTKEWMAQREKQARERGLQ